MSLSPGRAGPPKGQKGGGWPQVHKGQCDYLCISQKKAEELDYRGGPVHVKRVDSNGNILVRPLKIGLELRVRRVERF